MLGALAEAQILRLDVEREPRAEQQDQPRDEPQHRDEHDREA
jgi:hypothetical protein